ncbi:DUF5324 family protein [Kitasatospora sp. McL0602]|uniref:DUF5324 family protein n=1 Tax=Kitasatospora sp. McL0602 TaxID=3439530 RepID=UPI003F8C12D0
MTRLDSARETADRTRETLAPYAASAKDTAAQLAHEARQRLTPAVEALGPKARSGAAGAAQTARLQYTKHLAPQLEHAFASLPPHTQQNTLKAVHRAQEAALAAKISAGRAADQAKVTVVPKVTEAVSGARAAITPVAQQAHQRGSAAITALHGNVSAAEISELAAKNARKDHRSGVVTGLAVAGTMAIGAGLLAWQWWRHQSSPEWLVEPPATVGSTAGHSTPEATMNGSVAPTTATTPQPDPKPERPKPHDPRKPH